MYFTVLAQLYLCTSSLHNTAMDLRYAVARLV